MGIGPTSQPWEGRILPLYYARAKQILRIITKKDPGSPGSLV